MNINDFLATTDFVANDVDGLPSEVIDRYTANIRPDYDYLTPMYKGSDWLFELTCLYQPRTGRILANSKPFIFGNQVEGTNRFNTHLAMEINKQIILIGRDFLGHNPSDDDYQKMIALKNLKLTENWGEPRKVVERHLSLPESIRMAYYHRFDGLNVPLTSSVGIYSRLLPFPIGRPWQPIDQFLSKLRLKKKVELVNEIFPEAAPKRKTDSYTNLMIFLDTRSSLSGKEGDVFFVKNHIQDGVIYYIRDANLDSLMILSEPEEAIDRYCEHVLLRKEERFDFMPYSKLL